MNPIYKQQAELAVARIDRTQMMLHPAVVIEIITEVLPMIAGCFTRKYSADPVEAAERFREAYQRDPKGIRKKLMKKIRAEATEPMEKPEAYIIADAIIWQMLSVEDEVIISGCMEAPPEAD